VRWKYAGAGTGISQLMNSVEELCVFLDGFFGSGFVIQQLSRREGPGGRRKGDVESQGTGRTQGGSV